MESCVVGGLGCCVVVGWEGCDSDGADPSIEGDTKLLYFHVGVNRKTFKKYIQRRMTFDRIQRFLATVRDVDTRKWHLSTGCTLFGKNGG